MCTSIVEIISVEGSGKGAAGWFPVAQAVVDYDHPTHALLEESVNIDIVNPSLPAGMRVALELTPDSARDLAYSILSAVEAADAWRAEHGGAVSGP